MLLLSDIIRCADTTAYTGNCFSRFDWRRIPQWAHKIHDVLSGIFQHESFCGYYRWLLKLFSNSAIFEIAIN